VNRDPKVRLVLHTGPIARNRRKAEARKMPRASMMIMLPVIPLPILRSSDSCSSRSPATPLEAVISA
jgi:hypothetical protein